MISPTQSHREQSHREWLLLTWPCPGWGASSPAQGWSLERVSWGCRAFQRVSEAALSRKELRRDTRANGPITSLRGMVPRRPVSSGPATRLPTAPARECGVTHPSSLGGPGSQNLLAAALGLAQVCRDVSPQEARGPGKDPFIHWEIFPDTCFVPVSPQWPG